MSPSISSMAKAMMPRANSFTKEMMGAASGVTRFKMMGQEVDP